MAFQVGCIDERGKGFGTALPGDVGHDLHVSIRHTKRTLLDRLVSFFLGRRVIFLLPIIGVRSIGTGIRLAMRDSVWCEIKPRSSTMRKRMTVVGGIIDSGYRGPLYVVLHNFGFLPRLIEDGERYAQVIFHPAIRPEIEFVPFFVERTDRGGRGWGSTGR